MCRGASKGLWAALGGRRGKTVWQVPGTGPRETSSSLKLISQCTVETATLPSFIMLSSGFLGPP